MPHSILVLLMYFDRPIMVKNALDSLLLANEHYQNWILGFHDDGSKVPGEPIVREILREHLHKVRFYRTEISYEEKIAKRGVMGAGLNKMMREIDADIGIMLCDDDAIHPQYFKNLDNYFSTHKKITNCWSDVIPFDPLNETYAQALAKNYPVNKTFHLNRNATITAPSNCLDASQVAWRINCTKEHNVWFLEQCEMNHDAHFYERLTKECGPAHYTGFISQYKGWHNNQLGKLTNFAYAVNNTLHLDTKKDKTKIKMV